MTDLIQVTTTLACQETAQELAKKLVSAKLAACVQIDGPIQSVYRWQGQIHDDPEWRCTIKSHRSRQDQLLEFIAANHPYETPEILVECLDGVSESYAKWLVEQLG